MKNILFLFLFSSCIFVNAQIIGTNTNDLKNKYTLGLELDYHLFNIDKPFSTLLTYGYKKITLKLGPTIAKHDIPFSIKEDKFRLEGGLLTFEFYPNPRTKIVNFYFLTNLAYNQRRVDIETINDYINYNNEYIATIGFGYNINLYKGLYLVNSFSLGNVRETTKYKSGYKNVENQLYGYFIVGIGYKFGMKKKSIQAE